ncbi:hypothetical protein PMAYCL1PPCAC_01168, partial [Pristionchus mayeri]
VIETTREIEKREVDGSGSSSSTYSFFTSCSKRGVGFCSGTSAIASSCLISTSSSIGCSIISISSSFISFNLPRIEKSELSTIRY